MSSNLVPPHSIIWGEIVTLLVKILKLYLTGGIEEKPASPVQFALPVCRSIPFSRIFFSRSRKQEFWIKTSTVKMQDLKISIDACKFVRNLIYAIDRIFDYGFKVLYGEFETIPFKGQNMEKLSILVLSESMITVP